MGCWASVLMRLISLHWRPARLDTTPGTSTSGHPLALAFIGELLTEEEAAFQALCLRQDILSRDLTVGLAGVSDLTINATSMFAVAI